MEILPIENERLTRRRSLTRDSILLLTKRLIDLAVVIISRAKKTNLDTFVERLSQKDRKDLPRRTLWDDLRSGGNLVHIRFFTTHVSGDLTVKT